MKLLMKFIFVFLFIIVFIGCNSERIDDEERALVGVWQLVEVYSDPGDGSGDWHSVENGYSYEFYSNKTFTSDRFEECDYGVYMFDTNHLTLDFGCEDFTAGIENIEGVFVEQFSFDSNVLILTPTYLFCVEECRWKFRRI